MRSLHTCMYVANESFHSHNPRILISLYHAEVWLVIDDCYSIGKKKLAIILCDPSQKSAFEAKAYHTVRIVLRKYKGEEAV